MQPNRADWCLARDAAERTRAFDRRSRFVLGTETGRLPLRNGAACA